MGHCGPKPNDCPKRAPLPFTRCPLRSCRKPLFDIVEPDDDEDDDGIVDPNEVKLFSGGADGTSSTVEGRLRVKVNRHMRISHQSLAEELGVAPDPYMVPNAQAIASSMQPAVPFPVHPADRPPAKE
jgi:hypothetical protein